MRYDPDKDESPGSINANQWTLLIGAAVLVILALIACYVFGIQVL